MELVARLEAGERAADLAAEAGVTAAAVSGWRRRLREEGALSLMTDSDIAARAPEPREAPSELEELRARCEELELRNAVLEGTIDILKKDPGADLSALTAAERAALADRLRGRFGLRAALAALSLPRSTFYDRLAAASAPDPYAALRAPGPGRLRGVRGRLRLPPRPRRARAGRRRAAARPAARRGSTRRGPVAVSEKVVRRIMAEEGLRARAPRAAPLQLLRRRGGPRGGAQPAAGRRRPRPARLLGRRPRRGPGHPTSPSSGCPTTRGRCTSRRPSTCSTATSPPSRWAPRRPRRSWPRCSPAPWPPPGAASRSTATAAGTTAPPTGSAPAGRPGWRGRCRARGTRRTTPPARVLRQAQGRVLPREGLARVSAERFAAELAEWIRWYREGRLKAFDEGGRKVYDTIAGRRRRLGLAA